MSRLLRSLLLGSIVGSRLAVAAFASDEGGYGVTPEDAQILLKDGNWRFVSNNAVHLQQDGYRRSFTAKNGQKPFAVILSCADSRVPPELLFDQGLGCLFVVRVAGNVARTDEVATVEYGTGHLGARLVVVMGHTMCGAVTAVVQKADVGPNVAQLVRPIVPAVERARAQNPGLTGGPLLEAAIRANVFQSVADLLRNSAELRELVAAGKVQIVGAMYYLSTGEVQFLGEHPEQTQLLGAAGTAAAAKPHDDTPASASVSAPIPAAAADSHAAPEPHAPAPRAAPHH